MSPTTQDLIITLGTGFAALAAIVSTILAIYAICSQQEFNRLSVRPIIRVNTPDYHEHFSILVKNYGAGSAIFKNLEILKDGQVIGTKSIVEQVAYPGSPTMYNDYASIIEGTTIAPNSERCLLAYKYNASDLDATQAANKLRLFLSELEVKVTYEDLYQDQFCEQKCLKWLGRNLK